MACVSKLKDMNCFKRGAFSFNYFFTTIGILLHIAHILVFDIYMGYCSGNTVIEGNGIFCKSTETKYTIHI